MGGEFFIINVFRSSILGPMRRKNLRDSNKYKHFGYKVNIRTNNKLDVKARRKGARYACMNVDLSRRKHCCGRKKNLLLCNRGISNWELRKSWAATFVWRRLFELFEQDGCKNFRVCKCLKKTTKSKNYYRWK